MIVLIKMQLLSMAILLGDTLRYCHLLFPSAWGRYFFFALPPPLLPFCSGHAFSLCVTSATSSLMFRSRIFSLRYLHHCFPFAQVTHFLLALPPPLLPFCSGHTFSPCVTSTTASLLLRSRIFSLRYLHHSFPSVQVTHFLLALPPPSFFPTSVTLLLLRSRHRRPSIPAQLPFIQKPAVLSPPVAIIVV